MPTPSSSTVTTSVASPVDWSPECHGAAVRGVLEGVADEIRRAPVRLARRRHRRRAGPVGAVDDQPVGAAGGLEIAPQSSDERREGRGSTLQDQRIGLEVGHVEDFIDERGQPATRLVDPFHVRPLLLGPELEVEDGLGVAADQRERRPQLVADGGHEPLAQFLEGVDRADIAQDRGRARLTTGRRCRRIAARHLHGNAGRATDRGLAIADRHARGPDLGKRAGRLAMTARDFTAEHVRARPTGGLRRIDPEQALAGGIDGPSAAWRCPRLRRRRR